MTQVVLEATKEQIEVIQCKARLMALFAGRRWGKNGAFHNRLIARCLSKIGFKFLFAALSYAKSREEFDIISTHTELKPFIKNVRIQPYPKIFFHNGSTADFRSLDKPHLLRGGGYDEIWIDEIQLVEENVLDTVILPMISDRRGTLVIAGQFRGVDHYLYKRFFLMGQEPNQDRIKSWCFPSSSGWPYKSDKGKAELEYQKSLVPKIVWDQEWECIPVANQKAVFDHEDLEKLKGGENCKLPVQGCEYAVCVDLGRIVDPSSYVVVEAPTNRVVETGVRPMKEKHEVTARFIGDVVRRYNNALCVVDCTGGAAGGKKSFDENLKFYRDEGNIPYLKEFYWGQHNKYEIITLLSLWVEQHKFRIPAENEELLRQMARYEFTSRHGKIEFNGGQGSHDDLVAALALGVNALAKGWIRVGGGTSAAVYA
jgi:hypothetical protein